MDVAGEHLISGRYRLGTVLGRGGMGTVWRAHDELLNRGVAVKELVWPASLSEEERVAACRRATSEAQVAARLSHRNVVRVYDVVEEDGRPWIVMELLPPRSLRDMIKQEGPLSPARAARIGLDILAALRAAHAEGIVHLDVKPANILIAEDRAVLTDFGIARTVGPSTMTAGLLIGSPSYISPERARGRRPGPASDLWGLGASLYAAVEGRSPFDREGGALASLTAAVADEAEPALHAGPLLWPVISGLLRKDPDQRLGAISAERMLRRLVAYSPAAASASADRGMAASTDQATPASTDRGTAASTDQEAPAGPAAHRARRSVLSAAALVIVASGVGAGLVVSGSPGHATAAGGRAASTPTPHGTHHKAAGGTRLADRPQQAAPVQPSSVQAASGTARHAAAKHGPGAETDSLLTGPHGKALGHGHAKHARHAGHGKGNGDEGNGNGQD